MAKIKEQIDYGGRRERMDPNLERKLGSPENLYAQNPAMKKGPADVQRLVSQRFGKVADKLKEVVGNQNISSQQVQGMIYSEMMRRLPNIMRIEAAHKEEPDNEQFTKELEDAKAKSEGKKPNTEIAKGSVQAVKQEELDINAINGVQMSTIEERMMTEPEKEKKEDIVKSMKKGMAGFKDRYGSRANDVMYATATKQAMK